MISRFAIAIGAAFLYCLFPLPPYPLFACRCSGAYIFRPASQTASDPSGNAAYTVDVVTGPVVSEARQTAGGAAGQWISQVARLWTGATDVELEWTIGPIDISNNAGWEVISRYGVAGWATQGAWDTDSNCRDFQHRVRDSRPSWNLTLSEVSERKAIIIIVLKIVMWAVVQAK